MSRDLTSNIYSVEDLLKAYKHYDVSEKEIILSFISELTSISIDALMEEEDLL